MNLFSTILSKFGLGQLGNPDKGEQISGPRSRSTDSGITVTDERAMQLSAVWACSRIISQTVACLPLKIYKRQANSSRKEVDRDYHLYRIFELSPNSFMSPYEFRRAMTLQRVLWGNAYALIERNGSDVTSLIPLRPEHMQVFRDTTGLVYHYSTEDGVVVFPQERIYHQKGMSVDGVMGLSVLAYARHTMGISVSADKYASKSFANGGRPGGVLMFDKFLTDDQRTEAAKLYEGISQTAENANKLWALEGGVKYQAIEINPDDMQMLESRRFQLSEIARFFGVPSHLINDTEKSTSWGSGIEQLNIGFLQYTLEDYLQGWESSIFDQLIPTNEKRRYFAEHDRKKLLRADAKTNAILHSTYVQNGIMDRNEVREDLTLEPRDGADELTAQINLAPVTELDKVLGDNDAQEASSA